LKRAPRPWRPPIISRSVPANCKNAEKIPGVIKVQDNAFMCSDPGQDLIMEDIKNGIVDRVVVASCAPGLHESTFRNAISRAGGNPYIYEHANIREQVSWVHHGDQATHKATRLVAAAAAKARELQPLEPYRVDAKKHVTIIGGGIAGLKSALDPLDLAHRGIDVTLVEKSPFLGGWTAKWDRAFPTDDPVSELVTALASEVLDNKKISIHTCSQITAFEGFIGNRMPTRTTSNDGVRRKKPLGNLFPWLAYALRAFRKQQQPTRLKRARLFWPPVSNPMSRDMVNIGMESPKKSSPFRN